MKKIFEIIVLCLILTSNVYANPKESIKKDGFVIPTNKWKDKIRIDENFEVKNPKDKIIIIYNHGSEFSDVQLYDCFSREELRNWAQLAGDEINNKEIMVYIHCQGQLEGDLGAKLSAYKYWLSKWEGPYPGTSKMDRRVAGNLKVIKKFINLGVPKNQIFMSGHSCGGWLTLLLTAKYMNEVGGGISLMPACNWVISKRFKVKEVGYEKAMEEFHKEVPGIAELRQKHIDTIKDGNAPILIFTHPMDDFEGLTSDWMDDVPNFNRVVVSKKLNKIKRKKCKIAGSNWEEPLSNAHIINWADCFMYYHPLIKEYIASRVEN